MIVVPRNRLRGFCDRLLDFFIFSWYRFGAVLRFEGQVSVFGWEAGPRYRDLFPSPPPAAAVPSCAESGVLGVLPGILGALQATEVLKLILGLGKPLSGRLWIYDALNAESTTLQLTADANRPPIQTLEAVVLPHTCAGHTVHTLSPQLARERLAQGWNACWIDVRSQAEVSQGQLPHIAHTHAHDTVPDIAHTLPQDCDWVLVCRTGQRAFHAAEIITPPAGHSLWVLEGGMTAWDRSLT